jgi:CubicO group peptidase (beta-lactamase class C family)
MLTAADSLFASIQRAAAETAFSGVVRVAFQGAELSAAWGMADRGAGIPNTAQTRFGIASGTKGFTAAAIACLIADGRVDLDSPARAILGDTIRNLPAKVSIRHLITHTAGIGDYYDEESIGDPLAFARTLPLDRLRSVSDFIPLLEAARPKDAPGGGFSYCNSGFVVLAWIVEAVSGQAYPEFLDARVFRPAGMWRTGLFCYDDLPPETSIGYVLDGEQWTSNAPYLPVRGGGDGGAFSTAGDCERFWNSWLTGRIAPQSVVDALLTSQVRDAKGRAYGHGFWLRPEQDQIYLEGYDPGISFRSLVSRGNGDHYTVLANTSPGAWPLVRILDAAFMGATGDPDATPEF